MMAFFWKRKESSTELQKPGSESSAPDTEITNASAGEAQPSEPTTAEIQQDQETAGARPGFFGRIRAALSERIQKTKNHFIGQIKAAVKAASKVDDNLIERIEEILIRADLGAETSMSIVERMKEFEARGATPDELLEVFKKELLSIVERGQRTLTIGAHRPHVILVVGVNGTGKTTTIGKLAAEMREAGLKVMLAAGDTFRAAAIEQLDIWASRTGAAIVKRDMGADPSGLCYDAMEKARDGGYDVLLIDTAGRLHTKTNLMEELKKVVRVIRKVDPTAPHDTLLVLDATTGQNAISQARVFTEALPVTGLIMTKLDGTAKGGVLIGIRNLFDIPVLKIGVGEGVEDLRDFSAQEFVDALFAE
ncbi:MAG: signal recognition particle-docking protein FtsY [Candidatus Sumerlaeaceae bacterium]|nr:signal recognition particle-docking protein FtsY [Candidatus Sumerlaeaceae bacterium]